MPGWCNEIFDLLEESELPLESVTSLDEEPGHASAIAMDLARAFCPSAQFEKGAVSSTPYNVGALVGHKFAFAQHMGSNASPSHSVEGDHPIAVANLLKEASFGHLANKLKR